MTKPFERWADKVLIGDDCWEWTAHCNNHGYGTLTSGQKLHYAHRRAYEIFVGEIPDGMCVLHRCDNPGCAKPAHLFLGTQADNVKDMIGKGRGNLGEKNGQAKLSIEDVRAIREHVDAGLLQYVVASRFGVSNQQVSRIVNRVDWVSV